MSLDIIAAYDRVNRKKLLEILVKKKTPWWIIRFVWSFFSDHSTTLEMPGHSSQDLFYINMASLKEVLYLRFSFYICVANARSSLGTHSVSNRACFRR